MLIIKILLILALVLIFLYAALSVAVFIYACLRRGAPADMLRPFNGEWGDYTEFLRRSQAWVREHYSEKVRIKTDDGLMLKALFIPCENAKGTIIAFHGYRSRALIDFAPECEFFHNLGYNVILPAQRSHDESTGRYITYGVKESEDCKLWVDYAVKRFGDADIFLAGISMGSATVTMASSLSLPQNVRGIIADCGYTSMRDEVIHVSKKMPVIRLFAKQLIYGINVLCKAFAGFDVNSVSPLEAVRDAKKPILFIHGSLDDFVPTYMVYELYEACASEKSLLIIEGAVHATAYSHSPEIVQKEIAAFFDKLKS